MYIKDYFLNLNEDKIDFYVDMDGVIADYPFIDGTRYDNKRPLYDSIKKLEEISKMPGVTMHVLSVTRTHTGIDEKNYWLDKYCTFFAKENRHLLSREDNEMRSAADLKNEFMKNESEKIKNQIVIIDDDPAVLRALKDIAPNIKLLKDSALVD